MPMLEGVDDEVTVVMTVFLMLMGVVVTWLFASFQQDAQADSGTQTTAAQTAGTAAQTAGTAAQTAGTAAQTAGTAAENANETGEERVRGEGEEGNNTNPVVTEPSEETNDNENAEPPPEPEIPEPQEGQIRVKIKYLDDRVRCVLAPANARISDFKRSHFGRELAQDLLVRLIHNGRELQSQNTLEQYNIQDMSTVHCLVVPLNRQPQQAQDESELTDLDLSHLMLPMFTLILALIWYCRILYRNFFNALSTLALVGITVLYAFTLIMTWRGGHQEQQQQHGAQRQRHPHQD